MPKGRRWQGGHSFSSEHALRDIVHSRSLLHYGELVGPFLHRPMWLTRILFFLHIIHHKEPLSVTKKVHPRESRGWGQAFCSLLSFPEVKEVYFDADIFNAYRLLSNWRGTFVNGITSPWRFAPVTTSTLAVLTKVTPGSSTICLAFVTEPLQIGEC